MIPHVANRGHSFVGAGLYYLHDKGADTSERVMFTQTRNLTTDDAEKAMRYMVYTAMHAEEKKREAGISVAGAKQSKGVVYAFSLSWHPDEGVSHGEMMQAADTCLQRLGLSEHEAVLVGHGDTEHPHVHVVVNLVHPDTGKIECVGVGI
jgi:Relaxase/Mobilisation nuclease domain